MNDSRFGFRPDRQTKPWEAKYPDFAVGNGEAVETAAGGKPADETTWGSRWIAAPADSHLHGFAFEDYRDLKGNTLASIALDRKSRLLVRFKPPEKHPEQGVAEYEYLFGVHAVGKEFFERMLGHPDPGKIVQEMIRAGVPYRPVRR